MSLDERYNKIKSNVRYIFEPENLNYIEVSFVKAANRRALAVQNYSFNNLEKYWIMEEAGLVYARQIIFEMYRDSIGPRYPAGAKVMAEEIQNSDWPTILPGVYAVAFGNKFALIKNKKHTIANGMVVLESGNLETVEMGGCMTLSLELVHKVWKVCKIVDAPAL